MTPSSAIGFRCSLRRRITPGRKRIASSRLRQPTLLPPMKTATALGSTGCRLRKQGSRSKALSRGPPGAPRWTAGRFGRQLLRRPVRMYRCTRSLPRSVASTTDARRLPGRAMLALLTALLSEEAHDFPNLGTNALGIPLQCWTKPPCCHMYGLRTSGLLEHESPPTGRSTWCRLGSALCPNLLPLPLAGLGEDDSPSSACLSTSTQIFVQRKTRPPACQPKAGPPCRSSYPVGAEPSADPTSPIRLCLADAHTQVV